LSDLSLKIEDLIKHYPHLYHVAKAGTWESIRHHGLLSTKALLDLFKIAEVERLKIEEQRRPEPVTIAHKKYGRAVIRDQKPMTDAALLKCLEKPFTPRDWYRLLNGNVFFWLDPKRLNRLLGAKYNRNERHCVLTLDSHRFVTAYAKRISLSPMNSGSTMRNALRRGEKTFLPITQFPFEQRRKTRSIENTAIELLVNYSVPDVEDFVIKVEERKGLEPLQTILDRGSFSA